MHAFVVWLEPVGLVIQDIELLTVFCPHFLTFVFEWCAFFPVLAVGDLLQAAPVKVTDTSVDRMVFDYAMWRATFDGPHGEASCLTGCHRQSSDDEFQKLLDRVRWGRAGGASINRINQTWLTPFARPVTKHRIRKIAVQEINQMMLDTIRSPEHTFLAKDVFLTTDSRFNKQAAAALRSSVDLVVPVKQSAVVILTRKVQDVVPGSRGIVKEVVTHDLLIEGRIDQVKGFICDFGGRVVEVDSLRFPAYDDVGVEVAYSEQIPLLLGWAITVHRFQGLTLDAVEIDFNLDTRSTYRLVYTALLRARSLSALRVCGLRGDLIRVSCIAVSFYEKNLHESGVAPEDHGRPPIENFDVVGWLSGELEADGCLLFVLRVVVRYTCIMSQCDDGHS